MNQTFTVSGMTCQHCVTRVQTTLSSIAGVNEVTVSLTPPRAIIESETSIELSVLAKALEDTKFSITAMPRTTPAGNTKR